VTSLNPAFEKITGWSRADWIGKPFSSILHPDDLPSALRAFHGALCGEVSPTLELRVRARSGEYLMGEFIMPPLIADGKVIGISGVARDITERKRVEENLRALMEELNTQKEFSDAIYNNTPSGIMVLDREGHILKINHPGAEILKISPTEALGKRLTAIYPDAKEMLTLDPRFGRKSSLPRKMERQGPWASQTHHSWTKTEWRRESFSSSVTLPRSRNSRQSSGENSTLKPWEKVISGVAHEIRNPSLVSRQLLRYSRGRVNHPSIRHSSAHCSKKHNG